MKRKGWSFVKRRRLLSIIFIGKLVFAYLEPGSSSFLLKILISSLVGLVVFFRQILGYARLLFNKLTGKKKVEQATAVSQQPSKNEGQ